jgi:hypothetical protein
MVDPMANSFLKRHYGRADATHRRRWSPLSMLIR